VGTIPQIARTAGATRLEAAMRRFRAGQRLATMMDQIAAGFTDAELALLAACFGRKE
jgi:cytochrome c553